MLQTPQLKSDSDRNQKASGFRSKDSHVNQKLKRTLKGSAEFLARHDTVQRMHLRGQRLRLDAEQATTKPQKPGSSSSAFCSGGLRMEDLWHLIMPGRSKRLLSVLRHKPKVAADL